MDISPLIRDFTGTNSSPTTSQIGKRLAFNFAPSRANVSDQLDIENADANDLSKAISDAINDSVIHKLFSALARTEQGLFEGYNDLPFTTDIDSTAFDQLGNDFSFSFSDSRSQSFEFNLSLDDSNFSLDLSFSRVQTTEFNFIDAESGLELSGSRTVTEQFSLSLDISFEQQEQGDPLILDLDFNSFYFSSVEENIQFDLNADGQTEAISNLVGLDAFLAIDLNQNGRIDNGLELFGDAGGAKNGFVDLARFDDNSDQRIDAQDRVFDQLLLLNFSQVGEQQLTSLADREILSLSLQSREKNFDYANNNQLTAVSDFKDNKGNTGLIGDFLLGMNQ